MSGNFFCYETVVEETDLFGGKKKKKRNYSSSRDHCWHFGHFGIFDHSAYIHFGEEIGVIGMLFQYPPSSPISLCRHFLSRRGYLAVH